MLFRTFNDYREAKEFCRKVGGTFRETTDNFYKYIVYYSRCR